MKNQKTCLILGILALCAVAVAVLDQASYAEQREAATTPAITS